MTIKTHKTPLPLDEYEQYNIPQEYSAFKLTFFDLDLQKIDDLEYEYQIQGYKIFHTDTVQARQGLYNFMLVIAKLEVTF